mgnify:CR=1 FL=1
MVELSVKKISKKLEEVEFSRIFNDPALDWFPEELEESEKVLVLENQSLNPWLVQAQEEEKQFLLHKVPVNIKPAKVESNHENLVIRWEDDHKTTLSLNKILQSSTPRYPKHKLWPKSFLPSKFRWADFLKNKNTALKALKDFIQYGAIILKEAPRKSNSLGLLSKRLGPIHETLFERIHNVSLTGHVYNVAHTSKGLPPHNDFASYKAQPSVQALHMLENECEGGESIIVDSLKLLNDFKEDHPKFFNILTKREYS